MDRGQGFLERLTKTAELSPEPFPGRTIVEISGENRVLIENHMGVKEYSREKILVNVKFGWICICGSSLELMRMTKVQLVICGRIEDVRLLRRGGGKECGSL